MFSNIFECNFHTFARDHVFLDALFVFHAFVRVTSRARRLDPGREDDKFMCAHAFWKVTCSQFPGLGLTSDDSLCIC